MPKINLNSPHTLSQEDATSRLQRFSESLQSKFSDQVKDLEQSWEGDHLNFSFKTFGIALAGRIESQPNNLALQLELPFTAMMFKGKIESTIKGQLEQLMR